VHITWSRLPPPVACASRRFAMRSRNESR
jgi:hypothetical protein